MKTELAQKTGTMHVASSSRHRYLEEHGSATNLKVTNMKSANFKAQEL
jgi:hypothetical protein